MLSIGGIICNFTPFSTLGGDADVDHSQIIAKMQSNYWGGHIPHQSRVSAPLTEKKHSNKDDKHHHSNQNDNQLQVAHNDKENLFSSLRVKHYGGNQYFATANLILLFFCYIEL